ncbi:uncharacterized protein LOC112491244 [Ziziphus jujuba]|uniref:Uncharacterized protein LOC112491244 n=1 Tax=Ziziphus jujuba TaxID=326968 RepID=A0ABM4A7R3_ZIZJJ|nr:uncharacterized protein LOC112491244 [Ziziphus jujuba]
MGERKLLGPEIVQATVDKVNIIWAKVKAAQDKQKSYVNVHRKDLEFEVGDQIVEMIGSVAYMLNLPKELSRVHDVFHISMLHKYILDSSHVLETPHIKLKDDLSCEE